MFYRMDAMSYVLDCFVSMCKPSIEDEYFVIWDSPATNVKNMIGCMPWKKGLSVR